MLENLLQFDALLDQYELAAGHRMPDDLTVSTVLRCLDSATRRHLEMVMDEGMNYAQLKDKLILLDKNTKAWSGDNFLRNLQSFNQPTSSSSTYQGPAPMEVDQVQFGGKGKSKSKGKQKGKKGGWFGVPYGGKYGGGQKGGNKGKSKHKGKKGSKGKNKGKQQKGKGYGGGNNTCRLCGGYGHWGNECPLKNNVNQVNSGGGASGDLSGVPNDATSTTGSVSTRRTSTTSSTSQPSSTASKSVRLVKMYHVATPPAEHPEIFELRSDLEEEAADDWYVRAVSESSTEWYQLDAGDEPQAGGRWTSDPLMDWYHGLPTTLDWHQSIDEEDETLYVCAVPAGELVVLDSGADISLLPYHLSGCGVPRVGGRTILEDAQGERLQTYGKRSARVECEGVNNDLVVIEDDFIVASVQSPLISLGRLLHRGWSLMPNNQTGAKMSLV
eukprot:s1787_g7.t1